MQHSGYFVDTNLLVLLIVGNVSHGHIPEHKRTKAYTVDDYHKLCSILGKVGQLFVTPSILTEVSNLLCRNKEMATALRDFIHSPSVEEVRIDSKVVVKRVEFIRLGLTDCGLLEVVKPETPLLTVDFNLARAALKLDPNIVEYFTRLE